jgi:trimeric autotransporter adhesin
VGAPYWGDENVIGLTYFYVRFDGVWYLESGFAAMDGQPLDQFGSEVALSADGNTAAIGSQRAMMYGSGSQGAVYTYTRSMNNTWNLQAKISGINAVPGEQDGKEVAISGDGHTILFNADAKDNYRGGIYIFADYPYYPAFMPIVKR